MNTLTAWVGRSRDWLDDRGRAAWIAAMVIGFILFWPIGLALLFYIIWSKRMRCEHWGRRARDFRTRDFGKTGNTAFDAYREETLRRLEEEREAFTSFLDQLRAAKDKAEFDQFMASRSQPAPQAG
ncbi:DUF2852 domain-containing protein [Amaricoccus solimangrovi]|uniref:DUF2852 domain-containing protein n=1 Tax=Amaricoccus solimangrovi TaxID=2589815 RepID=A0A501WFG1_9RHOB|nr:DUF2852 domain-containing protein [Amaricoccus solimangrovi]TPE48299.1 DUF2852 domain-containing protein [Amaricoccus solimangrovi]